MIRTYPLPIEDFIEALPIKSISFDLSSAATSSQTEGGELISTDTGIRLWQGEVTLGRMTRPEARNAMALIDMAHAPAASFMIYDTTAPYPLNDPNGTNISGATPNIQTLYPDEAQLLQFKDFPAGYTLSVGDYVAFEYGSDPVRFALHRFQTPVSAAQTGITAQVEVMPPLQPGAAIDMPVTVSRPSCKAKIIPGSVQTGRQDRFMRDGVSFRFVQTLR